MDKEADKKRSDWKLSVRWAWFIGENREPLKLTTKPEPYTLDRTLRWIQRQVDPTLKMLETITAKTGIDYLKEIRKSTKLTEKHYKIIEQQTTSTEDVILEKVLSKIHAFFSPFSSIIFRSDCLPACKIHMAITPTVPPKEKRKHEFWTEPL